MQETEEAIYGTLRTMFGFESFRPGQEAVIRQLTQGQSALAVFPTGSGKSLCYQLSALLLDGLTLVVSPLIALMKDQITIVYVTLQPTAELVATALTEHGFPAKAYHAGMDSEERAMVQDWFMESHDAIVVATIAFGMGIDKAGIRYVYHYNLPKSLENYSQKIERAGRDGGESLCEILASPDDVTVLENFTYGDTPDTASVEEVVDAVLAGGETFDVSIHQLSSANDMRPLVVNTLLTYLELADIIEATAPFYSEYRFLPLRPSREILARFDPERAAFLKDLFACAVKSSPSTTT